MLTVFRSDEPAAWDDGADYAPVFDPDTPVVEPVALELLAGKARIYYGDYKNDLEPVLAFKVGGLNRRAYGTDDPKVGMDPYEFCEQASKNLAGSDKREFDGDVPEFIAWFFREWHMEVAARRRWNQVNAMAERGDIRQEDTIEFYQAMEERHPLLERCECRKSKKKRLAMKPEGTGNNWTCPLCGFYHQEKPRAGKPTSQATMQLIKSLPLGSDRRAACMIMWQAGLRIAECLDLTWADLMIEPGQIYVASGKRSKPRFTIISPDLERELAALLKAHLKEGKVYQKDRVINYSRSALQKWLDRHDACAHQNRHRFGYEMAAAAGVGPTSVLLGHSSLAQTMRYVHTDPADIARALGWQE